MIGPNPTDRGRSGNKLSVIVEKTGIPIGYYFSKANVHDSKLVKDTFKDIKIKLPKGNLILADLGYDSNKIRNFFMNHNIRTEIPKRKNSKTPNKEFKHNKLRYVVEALFGWLDKFRRLIVRYEKKMINYEAFTCFAYAFIIYKKCGY